MRAVSGGASRPRRCARSTLHRTLPGMSLRTLHARVRALLPMSAKCLQHSLFSHAHGCCGGRDLARQCTGRVEQTPSPLRDSLCTLVQQTERAQADHLRSKHPQHEVKSTAYLCGKYAAFAVQRCAGLVVEGQNAGRGPCARLDCNAQACTGSAVAHISRIWHAAGP